MNDSGRATVLMGERQLLKISMHHICMKILALFRHSKLNLLAYLVLTAE